MLVETLGVKYIVFYVYQSTGESKTMQNKINCSLEASWCINVSKQ